MDYAVYAQRSGRVLKVIEIFLFEDRAWRRDILRGKLDVLLQKILNSAGTSQSTAGTNVQQFCVQRLMNVSKCI